MIVDRENHRDVGQLDQRRRSLGSQVTAVVRESGDTPNPKNKRRSFCERISENKVYDRISDKKKDSLVENESQTQSVISPVRGHNLHTNHTLTDKNKIQCKKKSSEDVLVDHKPPIIPHRRDSTHNSQDSKSASSSKNDACINQNAKESKVSLQRSNSRSNSVVDGIHENSPLEWLEKKKRSSSLPTSDRSQLSTLDMEAAFTELLSAVDDDLDPLSDTEVRIYIISIL